MTPTLDQFERTLLTELRQHVAERAVVPRRRGRRRLAALGAGVLAAGSVATGAVLLSPDPAFAVHEESNGDVVVSISSLKDADGLERALAEHGVDADVTYDADAEPPPAPEAVDEAPEGATFEARGEDGEEVPPPPPGEADCGSIAVELTADGVTFRLTAAAVAADAPLRIETAGGDADGWGSIAVQWEGSVC
ncbi:hypothetical protein [Nocardioides humi]|uniref:Uncharacterized protein n=1 Tax=Nocardioides humi TaxID=449461 RepID=A0ABN2BFP7_9ACTN|nr:hypothetical protein [Nocardioides humi]